MKILIIYSYFCTPEGSWSTRWYEFARRWVQEGHDVQVLTAPYEKSDMPKKAGDYLYEGIKVRVYNTADNNKRSAYYRAAKAMSFASRCTAFAISNHYDVLIASSGPLTVSIPMILAKKWKKAKTVLEVRDLWPEAAISMSVIKSKSLIKWSRKLEAAAYNNADVVVATSPGQQEYIANNFSGMRVEYISNSSDAHLFNTSPVQKLTSKDPNTKLILHMGSLGFIHNCKFWIDVATETTQENIRYVFIGEGSEKSGLKDKVEKKRLQNVEFINLVPKNQLQAWTSLATASIFSTIATPMQETCSPNKLYDSLQAGLPIIQSTKGWIHKLVANRNLGINVDVEDPKHTAEQIQELVNSPDKLEEMSENAKKVSEELFNRDKLSKQYLNIIKSITE